MAVWRFVNLNIPEAQLLADLTGIENDLDAAAAICDLLLKELAEGQPSVRLIEALTASALVRFARSFKSGVRSGIPESVFEGLSPEQLADHQLFIDLRDKYIAHSVNAFEENQVVAYLVPEERGPRSVSSISVQQNRIASLGTSDANRLKALSLELRQRVARILEAENQKVLIAARALPVDVLYNQVDPSPKVATDADAGKPRKRFVTANRPLRQKRRIR